MNIRQMHIENDKIDQIIHDLDRRLSQLFRCGLDENHPTIIHCTDALRSLIRVRDTLTDEIGELAYRSSLEAEKTS